MRALVIAVIAVGAVITGVVIAVVRIEARNGSGPRLPSASVAGTRLLRMIDAAEFCAHAGTGGFTSNLEDLNDLSGDILIIAASASHLAVQVVASVSAQSFFARVTGRGSDQYINVTPTLLDETDVGPLTTRCSYSSARARRLVRHG